MRRIAHYLEVEDMFIRGEIVDIEFTKHINVIDGSSCDAGDSGIGKTFMFDSLNEAYENRKLTSDKNLHFFSSIRTANNLQFTENDCIILDEANYAPNELDQILQMVRQSLCYLIVIGRLYIKQLEYAVDSIYTVVYDQDHDVFTLQHTFEPSDNHTIFNTVATEDSTSIASVYSECLEKEVIPVFGRSNFFDIYKRNVESPILLIADMPKFGPELFKLIFRLRDKYLGTYDFVYLFLPECFEQICVLLTGVRVQESKEKYFDSEEMYERILQADCGVHWGKNSVSKDLDAFKRLYRFRDSEIIKDLCHVVIGRSSSMGMFYQVSLLSDAMDREYYYHCSAKNKTDTGK